MFTPSVSYIASLSKAKPQLEAVDILVLAAPPPLLPHRTLSKSVFFPKSKQTTKPPYFIAGSSEKQIQQQQ